ncbi:MAG: threonine--tRNA ligase [Elusimicrobia bacterium]|jgi:threonyl-tRNA synthetase|nr:threonine--tRNA ligase [Elusimicrobiota bacterium]
MSDNIEKLRHSTSHIMADAVMKIYGDVKIGIGPAIENGFYYDFDIKDKISEDDLEKIENEMTKVVEQGFEFEREVVTRKKALEIFKDQPYKKELINELPENEDISIYRSGDFVDLCRGPHIEKTSAVKLKSFKLLKVAGAYWKGEEKNKMLTRIYGTVFETPKALRKYIRKYELAKKRDHRKLGKKLDLFSIQPRNAGAGLVFWHPNGAAVRREIENFWLEEHRQNGYEFINIPHIANSNLWKTSGHLDFYSEYMFPKLKLEERREEYILKPMNCPGHILVYKNNLHSYREFPLRWAELGTVYRYEKTGVLHGLMRVRGFTQDDAHIFCRRSQVDEEIEKVLKFTLSILKTFGFKDYKVFLSTRPDKYVGDDAQWKLAEDALKKGLKKIGLDYEIDPGEGVFYGPKVDIKIKDSLDRMWQCSTIQVDFNIPEKFDMNFVNKEGNKERPVMIHRAIFGSLERFFGILIEHYGGRFPLWLAPVQLELIPISDDQLEYCNKLKRELLKKGIRVAVNNKDEKLGKKIWQARDMEIPYMAIVGDREIESGKLSIRKLSEGDIGTFTADEFIQKLRKEINRKK